MDNHLQFNSDSKVLVRLPNWLGDVLIASGFCLALLESLQKCKGQLDLLTIPALQSIPLAHNGKTLLFDKTKTSPYNFGKTLRDQGYTHFFILPPSFSSALMAYSSKIPYRIGYANDGRSFLLNPACKYQNKQKIPAYIEHLHLIGKDKEHEQYQPNIRLTTEEIDRVLPQRWQEEYANAIFIAPFTAYGRAKEWFPHRFIALAKKLTQQGEKVVFVGMRNDTLSLPSKVYNLCGETNIIQLIALFQRGKLAITNDSGAMHVASALGIPQIAIYGSTSRTWTPPLNKQATIIQQPISCSPCFQRTCPLGHYHCLTQISVDEVFTSAMQILNQKNML